LKSYIISNCLIVYSPFVKDDLEISSKNAGSNEYESLASPIELSKAFQTLTDAANISWTYSLGYNAKVTINGNRTLTIVGATSGDYGTLVVTQGTGGNFRINFGSNDKFPAGTYSFSSSSNQIDIFGFLVDGSIRYWNYNINFR